jgi:hypothetical protein
MSPSVIVLISVASVLLFIEVSSGFKNGLAMQMMRFVAVVFSYGIGFFGSSYLYPTLRVLALPDFVLRGLAGVLIGFLGYLLIINVGKSVFKTTAQQDSFWSRFVFGSGGAFFGMIFATLIMLVFAIGIRLTGSLLESRMEGHPVTSHQIDINDLDQTESSLPEAGAQNAFLVSRFFQFLLEMKQTLESGDLGHFLLAVDPVPERVYQVIGKFGQVISNEESVRRLLASPRLQTIFQRPELEELKADPDFIEAVNAGNYVAILRNDRFVALLNAPEVKEALTGGEIEKALDNALSNTPQ